MRLTLPVFVACAAMASATALAEAQSMESKPLGLPRAASSSVPPPATTPATLGSAAMRTGASLAAVVLLIGGAALGFKTLAKKGVIPSTLGTGARAPSGLLEVLARYPMGGGQVLVVLKFDRRILLVCQSAAKGLRRTGLPINPICEISEPEDVASVLLKVRGKEQAAMAEKFQQLLAAEDSAAERTLVSAPARPPARAMAARAHERSTRPAPPVTGGASATAIRSRLSAMRQQPPEPASRPATRPGRTEFVA
ncbi:MAG: hypothetical protein U0637_14880 [Phycisphaerales bacterium]